MIRADRRTLASPGTRHARHHLDAHPRRPALAHGRGRQQGPARRRAGAGRQPAAVGLGQDPGAVLPGADHHADRRRVPAGHRLRAAPRDGDRPALHRPGCDRPAGVRGHARARHRPALHPGAHGRLHPELAAGGRDHRLGGAALAPLARDRAGRAGGDRGQLRRRRRLADHLRRLAARRSRWACCRSCWATSSSSPWSRPWPRPA